MQTNFGGFISQLYQCLRAKKEVMSNNGETTQSWNLALLNLKPPISKTKPQKSMMAPYKP
jgi:hypothetical protein